MVKPGRFRQHVAKAVQTHQLWPFGASVGVAVSGGVDSVVLLDTLVHTQRMHGAKLSVLTVDHGQHDRSQEAITFVHQLADEYKLPVRSTRLHIGEGASEARMREARLAWLSEQSCERVALGHHLNDQAETVLMQMMRGTGLRGYAGMRWRRDTLVRPMLEVQRETILEYASDLGLRWIDDPSNSDVAFTRNRIRHEVLPLLEDMRPGVTSTIARTGLHVRQEADALDEIAAHLAQGFESEISVKELESAPAAVVRRALIIRYPTIKSSQLDQILEGINRGSGKVVLNQESMIEIKNGRLTFTAMV